MISLNISLFILLIGVDIGIVAPSDIVCTCEFINPIIIFNAFIKSSPLTKCFIKLSPPIFMSSLSIIILSPFILISFLTLILHLPSFVISMMLPLLFSIFILSSLSIVIVLFMFIIKPSFVYNIF